MNRGKSNFVATVVILREKGFAAYVVLHSLESVPFAGHGSGWGLTIVIFAEMATHFVIASAKI